MANNTVGGGGGRANANWTVAISPQNDEYGKLEMLEDVILEGNKFIHQSGWGGSNLDIAWGGRRFTSRNNTVQGSGSVAVGKGHTILAAYDGPYFTN